MRHVDGPARGPGRLVGGGAARRGLGFRFRGMLSLPAAGRPAWRLRGSGLLACGVLLAGLFQRDLLPDGLLLSCGFLICPFLAGRLVRGYRGGAAADAEALVSLVHRLSQLAVDVPELAELDLNPVIATATGCVAVDARVRLRARPDHRSLKSW